MTFRKTLEDELKMMEDGKLQKLLSTPDVDKMNGRMGEFLKTPSYIIKMITQRRQRNDTFKALLSV